MTKLLKNLTLAYIFILYTNAFSLQNDSYYKFYNSNISFDQEVLSIDYINQDSIYIFGNFENVYINDSFGNSIQEFNRPKFIRINQNQEIDFDFKPEFIFDSGLINYYSLKILPNRNLLFASKVEDKDYVFNLLSTEGLLINSFRLNSEYKISEFEAINDSTIILVGDFNISENDSTNHILKISIEGKIDSTFSISANAQVNSISKFDSESFLVGGNFTEFNSFPQKYLSRMFSTGEIDELFNSELNNPIDKLFYSNELIFVSIIQESDSLIKKVILIDSLGNSNSSFTFNSDYDIDKVLSTQFINDTTIYLGYFGVKENYTNYIYYHQYLLDKTGSIQTPLPILWTYENSVKINSSAISNNGAVFVGSNYQNDNYFSTYKPIDFPPTPIELTHHFDQSYSVLNWNFSTNVDFYNIEYIIQEKNDSLDWHNVDFLLTTELSAKVYNSSTFNNPIYRIATKNLRGRSEFSNVSIKIIVDTRPKIWSNFGIYENTALNGEVYAIAQKGDTLYFGGRFNSAFNINEANNIVMFDGVEWKAIGSGLNDWVRVLKVIDDTLYAGGGFTSADGTENTNYLAKWDGNSWRSIGNGVNGFVIDIHKFKNDIYVGGLFTSADNDNNIRYIGKFDGQKWSTVGDWVNDAVYTINDLDDILYIGGAFTYSDKNLSLKNIAKLNSETNYWESMGSGANHRVEISLKYNNGLYFGGRFSQMNNLMNSQAIVFWNGSQFETVGNGLNGVVWGLDVLNGEIYAGGNFESYSNNNSPKKIAKFNGKEWVNLGENISGDVFRVKAVQENSSIYIGGNFYDLNGIGKLVTDELYNPRLTITALIEDTVYTNTIFSDSLFIKNTGLTPIYLKNLKHKDFKVFNENPSLFIAPSDSIKLHFKGLFKDTLNQIIYLSLNSNNITDSVLFDLKLKLMESPLLVYDFDRIHDSTLVGNQVTDSLVIHNSSNRAIVLNDLVSNSNHIQIDSLISEVILNSGESYYLPYSFNNDSTINFTDSLYLYTSLTKNPYLIQITNNSYVMTSPILDDVSVKPNSFEILNIYPNPFNPSTTIEFNLPKSEAITIQLYDIIGRKVLTVISNSVLNKGKHSFQINAKGLASGIYIIQLRNSQASLTKKITLLK